MDDSNSQKNDGPIDVFLLARKQLEERRKISDEQEQRWADRSNINYEFVTEKDENHALENLKVGPDDSILIFCGAPNSGKSTLISRFLESGGSRSTTHQPPEKSIAFEYKFVNRRVKDYQLVHCWELAGGGSLANLLEIPFNQPSRFRISVLLFIDLTIPEHFQQVIEPIISVCRKHIGRLKRVPLVLVCARYDDFQKFESERRRLTYRLIRQFALINGASIISFSSRMDSLIQKALLVLSSFISDLPCPKSFATDPQQPLFVLPYGFDSFEKIDPSTESLMNSITSFSEAMFNFTHSLNSAFPQIPLQLHEGRDERDRQQQFDEPCIDLLVEEQMRKLELHARELQDRLLTEKKVESAYKI